MSTRHAFLMALLAIQFYPQTAGAAEKVGPTIPDLKVEKYTLPNGLDVILHEDHTTPEVAVNIWYKVGSLDEKRGRTGFAHLFEHLMFQGSKDHDTDYFGPLEKAGAEINGSTTEDRTNYFETLPGNALELALWLESDRMGLLLPALSQEKLDNQRDVVKNERRQSVDNVPYGQSEEKIAAALYPPNHPYHHSVIGSMADLSAASLADVSAFFRTYYSPNNATLCIAGDIDKDKAKALVAKYFGPIPRGAEVKRPKPEVPKLEKPIGLAMTDRVTLPRATLVWPTVPVNHPDEAALDILAEVLGELPRENRLYRTLVYDKQVASSVSASHPTRRLSGEFHVTLNARPGEKLEPLVTLADAEIARLQAEGPTAAEVHKAQVAAESQLVIGIQSIGNRADLLNANNVEQNDPLGFVNDLKKLFAVTPADVQRVARQYLTANRVRLDVTPGDPTPRAPEVAVNPRNNALLAPADAVAIKDNFDRSKMPAVGPPPLFAPPAVTRRKLSNGLEVLVSERHDLPILSVELVVKGGETLVPSDKLGLAAVTASLLRDGTSTLDALSLAGALSDIGATLWASGALESSSVGITALTGHTDKALDLLADVLLHPSFPEAELKRHKVQRLAAVRARVDSANSIASVVLQKLIFGAEHLYGRPFGSSFAPNPGTEKTIEAITRDDVVAFYKKLFNPANSSLVVVGDTTPDAIVAALEKRLGPWPRGNAITPPIVDTVTTKGGTLYLVDKPTAPQSFIAVGEVGVPRSSPDYIPLTVMNELLGGQFSSRINLNLREDKGYTYGAYSAFSFRLNPGPFTAGAAVQTAVTREALTELIKELNDIVGPRPVTQAELDFAKDRLIRGFPAEFETTYSVANTLSNLVLYNLPDDEFTTFTKRVDAVTLADVHRVAKQYIHPDRLVLLVVGDRNQVESGLRKLPFARAVEILDAQGNPPAPVRAGAGH